MCVCVSVGFGTMMNSMASKSVAKSIVRNMEMNGTLETRPARLKQKEVRSEEDALQDDDDEEEEDDDEEDEEEEEEEEMVTREVRKGNKVAPFEYEYLKWHYYMLDADFLYLLYFFHRRQIWTITTKEENFS